MKIALTAAIMDVFHNGHKNILENMRKRADKVIVVLHDDYACYRIKGKIPMQTVRHRKRNLLLTGLVDKVYITKSIDPADKFAKVIKKYDDIIFLRGDDNVDFPGKWLIEKHNIPIIILPYTKEVSSTKKRDAHINSTTPPC